MVDALGLQGPLFGPWRRAFDGATYMDGATGCCPRPPRARACFADR
jgi:hypothetical protein